jgi:hypothetical protein
MKGETPEEREVRELKEALDRFDRDPKAAAAISRMDQLRAEIRDMDSEQLEALVPSFMEQFNMTEERAREYIQELRSEDN